MMNVPLLDELRATRERLAEATNHDIVRYAAMLREVALDMPGNYVTKPGLLPVVPESEVPRKDAG